TLGVVHSGCCGIRLFKEKTKIIINNDLETVITNDSNILNSGRGPQASSQDLQESSQDSQNITSHVKVKQSKKGNKTE
ncbi:41403_t:CDS:2, partial [Gigaspora margarita]